MLRNAASKAAWVGRTASMVFGLALVMALVLGVSSAALAGNLDPLKIGSLKNVATKTTQLVGKVASGSVFVVKNPSGGSALGLQVGAGKAPLTVNPEAGTATNLDSDELDGKDSDEILPLVRAQKDGATCCTDAQTGSSVTANTVPITAPTDGFLVISGSMELYNSPGNAEQNFVVKARLDNTDTGEQAIMKLGPGALQTQGFGVTVPVSAGEHTVHSVVVRSGSGSWYFNRNNLNVMFVPQGRGAVTDTDF